MKNVKRILAIATSILMIASIATGAVHARSARVIDSYIGEEQISIYNGTTLVGRGSFDFGTVRERGAYGSCTTLSSSYPTAYCKLMSYAANGTQLDADTGYTSGTTYASISEGLMGDRVDGIWRVYKPTSSGTVPSNSPSASASFTCPNYDDY